jgi:hypothetical protein
MSTELERELTQVQIREQDCASRNKQAHQIFENRLDESGRMLNRIEKTTQGLARSVRIGALVLAVGGLVVPAWSQIRAAYANEHTAEVAREATRQEFDKLKAERAVEIQSVADAAAKKAVNLVVIPAERVTK